MQTPAADPKVRAELRAELLSLTTEAARSDAADLDELDTLELVLAMNREDAIVPGIVASQADDIARAVDGIANRLARGGRLFYLGAGTPGRIGVLDASECPPTFGTDPSLVVGLIAGGHDAILTAIEHAEDDDTAARAELAALDLSELDTVVGLSASGRTPYVVGGLLAAREVGALTVSVASNAGSPIAAIADVAIDVVVGPEFVAGSTRLKSGTAQKLVLNMLSTLSMIRLGKTYQGVMVDLRATNEKLVARSELTVMRATGADASSASVALAAADGGVKEAILMLKTGAGRPETTRALQEARGILRLAIEALTPPVA
ncbi:N-acetylmuramic acid 6-phosphate etherase [Leucobacter aridicollis]|uniref:N-acetylmuramic acid 6-phosphate etherase n=1 Tax=Leucobacter aridicollis TaxID=283878 RepID=UPI000E646A85|nr:N-acetylmuramic acid 6-phosphate etherase [Leucobacter aridicollis]UTX53029.1 N-acetylmuramic acid 6-phosphate etherase [Leucobacter aridicollis]